MTEKEFKAKWRRKGTDPEWSRDFKALIRAVREDCAMKCNQLAAHFYRENDRQRTMACNDCAAAIRRR